MKEANEAHFLSASAATPDVALTGTAKGRTGALLPGFFVMMYGVIPWADLGMDVRRSGGGSRR